MWYQIASEGDANSLKRKRQSTYKSLGIEIEEPSCLIFGRLALLSDENTVSILTSKTKTKIKTKTKEGAKCVLSQPRQELATIWRRIIWYL